MDTCPALPQDYLSQIKQYIMGLQRTLCQSIEQSDGQQKFTADSWRRENGSEGISCILEEGAVFEKAGVNFSHIFGNNLPPAASASRPQLAGRSFHALGLSLVIHPRNPYVPTSHANIRFFVAEKAGEPAIWWFGGCFDLTPYYGFKADCVHWHKTAQAAYQPFGDQLYGQFKQWCDNYFYIKHRQEARGIGGIFFDDYCEHSFEHSFGLAQSTGNAFSKAYLPIVERRKELEYGKRERDFQLYRRGRYTEFNLIYDRGTLFGLQSGGRVESILMSMPPQVSWRYNWHPEPGSPESALYEDFLPVRDWLS